MIQANGSGHEGRDALGRFGRGNPGGPGGNPQARRMARLRAAMLRAVTPDEIRCIIGVLVAEAKAGNVQAAREVLDRCLGRPEPLDFIERVERLEAVLETVEIRRTP